MNRVKVGVFSLSQHSAAGDDRPYLEWHQLDHMPEQYQVPGIVFAQRWASTPACRAAREAEVDTWSLVEHVVSYLMGEPVDQTIDDFLDLGRRLGDMGRFSHHLPNEYLSALGLLESHAAPRALVSPEVVPFRPNRGIYLAVEAPRQDPAWDDYLRRVHAEVLPRLLEHDGVAGAWVFSTSPRYERRSFSPGRRRITLFYLDEDPATVGADLGPALSKAWEGAPTTPLLAAPFESMMHWDWQRFSPP
jgi:hypothetical protein